VGVCIPGLRKRRPGPATMAAPQSGAAIKQNKNPQDFYPLPISS
jgi:hypothetical protein